MTSADQLLRYFEYEHLPEHLQRVSKGCAELALQIVTMTPPGAEQTAGLRKLLEAKDCFVRAALDNPSVTIPLRHGAAADMPSGAQVTVERVD